MSEWLRVLCILYRCTWFDVMINVYSVCGVKKSKKMADLENLCNPYNGILNCNISKIWMYRDTRIVMQ